MVAWSAPLGVAFVVRAHPVPAAPGWSVGCTIGDPSAAVDIDGEGGAGVDDLDGADGPPLGKNPYEASVRWLVQMDALTQEQADAMDAIRAHRHEIAHELARLLVDPDADISVERLDELQGIMRSLDRFWGGIEVDINPDFDEVDVDLDAIVSGAGALLTYVLQLAGIQEADGEGAAEAT